MKVLSLKKLSKTLVFARTSQEKINLVQALTLVVWLLFLTSFFTILFFGYTQISLPQYSVDDIARADVVVPFDVFVEDETETNARRTAARNQSPPVYRYEAAKGEILASKLSQTFSECRSFLNSVENSQDSSSLKPPKSSLRNLPPDVRSKISNEVAILNPEITDTESLEFLMAEQFGPELAQNISGILRKLFRNLMVEDKRSLVRDRGRIQIVNTVSGEENIVPLDRVVTMQQVRETLNGLIGNLKTAPSSRPHIRALVSKLLVPNLRFDLQMTQLRQDRTAASVEPVLRLLKKGKTIVRRGDEVQLDQLRQIEAIRKLMLNPVSIKQVSGKGVLIASLLLIFGYFLRSLSQVRWSYFKLVALCSGLLVTNILLLKVFWFVYKALSRNFVAAPFSDKQYFFFALPFAFGAMLITLLAGERIALVFSIFYCVLAGLALDTDLYGFFYVLMSNLIGNLAVRNAMQRVGIVGAGFKQGVAAVGLFVVLQMSRQLPFDLSSGSFGAALAFLSGPINASLLLFILPLCERLFMVTTDLRLLELGNLNLPVIRDMIIKAPGTYNHSVAVGTLSEGAAKAIGLNPVFLRVACLYHDIGKSLHPEYFVENQQGFNIHDKISPQESVRVVIGHVHEGIRMARAAGIPSNVVDIIPQHHGTKVLTFFFEKAKKLAGPDASRVSEEDYRYPGPKPKSKEAAIVMLADAVEASARTLHDYSQENFLELIQKLVATATEDGQFSECDITLAEIDRVAFSFLETLSSIYHTRLTDPGFEFDQKTTPERSRVATK